MTHLSRRNLLKATGGLIAFIPAARALALAPKAFAGSCDCSVFQGYVCTCTGPSGCAPYANVAEEYNIYSSLYGSCTIYCYTTYTYNPQYDCCTSLC